jgi:hypothetical protein
MFSLDDLVQYSLKVDLSKHVPTTQGASGVQLIENLTLGTLRKSSLSDAHIALGKIAARLPVISYSQIIGRYHVELQVLEDLKMEFEVNKSPDDMPPREDDRNLAPTDLQNLTTDFNFLFGNLRGLSTARDMPGIKARLSFRKSGQLIPWEKLGTLRNDIRILLANPRTEVLGLHVESYDDSDTKHLLDVSQDKDSVRFRDSFEFQPAGPVVLEATLGKSLKLVNSVYARLGGSA